MQSQLQAALLGHGCNTNISLATEDEDKDETFEEGDDVDEFIDEVFISFVFVVIQ